MIEVLKATVPGIPRPQGSKTVMRGRPVEASKYLAQWRKDMVTVFGYTYRGEPLEGAVKLEAVFWFPIAKSRKDLRDGDLHTQVPDTDKLVRAVCDALKIAGVVTDDAQIAITCAEKRWCTRGSEGVCITVSDASMI